MRAGRLVARARRPRRDLGRRRQPVRTARGDGSGCARDLDRIASRHGARRGPLRRGAGSDRGPRGRRRAGGVASPLDPVRRRLPRRGGLAVPQRVLRQPRALRPRRAGRSGGHRRRRDVGCRGAGRARAHGRPAGLLAARQLRRGPHRAGARAGAFGQCARGRQRDRRHGRLHGRVHRRDGSRRHGPDGRAARCLRRRRRLRAAPPRRRVGARGRGRDGRRACASPILPRTSSQGACA